MNIQRHSTILRRESVVNPAERWFPGRPTTPARGAEGWRIKLDPPPENVGVASVALREWAGLPGYRLTGKIAELVPGP